MAKIYGDRWEVKSPLGEGGQAHTFLVIDNKGDREAIYVLKRLKNVSRIDRFKAEIEAVRNLTHENIVRLIDFDLDSEKPFLVTEYCAGKSLSQAESFWKNSTLKALEIFLQICHGVEYAHKNNIIHRDLKPDNIFLRTEEGPAVVGDFGICYLDDDRERITLTEEAVGPRLYIAPELEDGRLDEISSRCDIYSLGKILYWLLSKGKIFSREKYREPEWDLKGKNQESIFEWDNIYMEHVNRLLDIMLDKDPKFRRKIDIIIGETKNVMRLIKKEFTPIAKDIRKPPCHYCGHGYYVLRVHVRDGVSNFGLQANGNPNWRIYTCNVCGHIQLFRVDLAEKRDWWE